MAQASLNDDEDGEDFQTPHTSVRHIVRQEEGGQGELATKPMGTSGGSLAWQSFVRVDISEEEPETLEEIDPHWRSQHWLQLTTQGITDEEVTWHELLALLTSGVEGTAKVSGQASCCCVAVKV